MDLKVIFPSSNLTSDKMHDQSVIVFLNEINLLEVILFTFLFHLIL